MLKDKRD